VGELSELWNQRYWKSTLEVASKSNEDTRKATTKGDDSLVKL
jgi:hypothetical protein